MGIGASEVRQRVLDSSTVLCPSLLQCDLGNLESEIADAERCGAQVVHWDVMDGEFVPNFTYGPPVIGALRAKSSLVFDTHLMMRHPQKYLDDFLAAGCDILTVHLEAVPDPGELLRKIREGGALAGLAINPPTPVEDLKPWLELVDLVLIMSVMPGFGGQKFDPVALEKLAWVRREAPPNTLIEVDGGVNRGTIAAAANSGARMFVVGSAFFTAADRRAEFDALSSLTPGGRPVRG
ncbi:MAG: ribulose-phosphate 3-epimerase [Planctomycetota bacterium]